MSTADSQFQAGFTMIELLVAMAVFSFMLLIIAVGFINVVRLHNEAVASNQVQDSANAAMQELVQAVRDSNGMDVAKSGVNPFNANFGTFLCLKNLSGVEQAYYVSAANVLTRADGCTALNNQQPLSSSSVNVTYLGATPETSGPSITKPEMALELTVASANGTATGTAGKDVGCNDNTYDREFCSTVDLTSGAVPR
jgi:prepilin-type N-terminal cleavage/methylation domain-containing protein